ncbi:hypothetical protein [Cohnella nanjingensis]|uniref:Uncharacterized protein n=1 Tax=Cohnella nanjingensis TaxID=1387779 RepID=A0A7X0RW07_9BACL|nr:hypothetical protein [Cohnella nanjingensis]MBB6674702.1 hypothetical protein [Cohnella nanjingensis]
MKDLQKTELEDQTAYMIAGIPTPPDQQDIAATDMLSEAVGELTDELQHAFEGKPNEEV